MSQWHEMSRGELALSLPLGSKSFRTGLHFACGIDSVLKLLRPADVSFFIVAAEFSQLKKSPPTASKRSSVRRTPSAKQAEQNGTPA